MLSFHFTMEGRQQSYHKTPRTMDTNNNKYYINESYTEAHQTVQPHHRDIHLEQNPRRNESLESHNSSAGWSSYQDELPNMASTPDSTIQKSPLYKYQRSPTYQSSQNRTSPLYLNGSRYSPILATSLKSNDLDVSLPQEFLENAQQRKSVASTTVQQNNQFVSQGYYNCTESSNNLNQNPAQPHTNYNTIQQQPRATNTSTEHPRSTQPARTSQSQRPTQTSRNSQPTNRKKASPISSARLPTIREKTGSAMVNILKGGGVCLEFYKVRNGEEIIHEVFWISSNGQQVDDQNIHITLDLS